MTRVSLSEFLLLSGISSEDLLSLLERGELQTEHDESGATVVVIREHDSARFPALASKPRPKIPPRLRPLVEEVVATELLQFLDVVLPEALALAAQWTQQSSPAESTDPE